MIVASGFIEANGSNNLKRVINELRTRGIEINEIDVQKVAFLIEKHDMNSLRAEIKSLRDFDYIKDVHLSYYSLEGRSSIS